MEEHPVPQNITSFEFKLVGDMTLKQFGYLATGLVLAYLTYVGIFSQSPVLAVPLIAIFALSGTALAFLPIYDRPLDHWISAYFHAVYAPTKAVYQNYQPAAFIFQNRLQIHLASLGLGPSPIPPVNLNTKVNIPRLTRLPQTTPLPQQPSISITQAVQGQYSRESGVGSLREARSRPSALRNLSLEEETNTKIVPGHPANEATPEAGEVSVQRTPNPEPPSSEELTHIVELAKDTTILQQKYQEAEKELGKLKVILAEQDRELSAAKHLPEPTATPLPIPPITAPSASISIAQPPTPNSQLQVKVLATPPPTKTTMLLTSSPNVVNGIVIDNTGNYLENAIVIIHNSDNIPVRALKTNKLGQFTGATPLPSGTYTLTLEKDSLEFDTYQVTLNSQVIAPIKISAKRIGTIGS